MYVWNIPDSGLLYAKKALALNEKIKGRPARSAKAWNGSGYAYYMKALYDSAQYAFQQYYRYSEKSNDKINMAFALNNEANIEIERANYDAALALHNKALNLRVAVNDSSGIAMSYNNIGFIYKDKGDWDNALKNFYFALPIFEGLKDFKAVAKTHGYIAIVQGKNQNVEAAVNHFKEAIALQEKYNDLNELAISRNALGSLYVKQNKPEAAAEEFAAALQIYKSASDARQIAMVSNDYAQVFLQKNQLDSALHYFSEAVAQNRKIGNKRNIIAPLLGVAEVQTKLKKYTPAKAALDTVWTYLEGSDRKDELRRYYQTAAQYYEAIGQYQQALAMQQQLTNIKDSLHSDEKTKAIADMSVKYETGKKEQEILLQQAEISRKNILLWSGAILFLLIVGLIVSIYRRYRLKQEAKLQKAILHQQQLATRAVIQAEENERQRIARDLHDGVGQMMSAAKMNLSAFESNVAFQDKTQEIALEKIIGLVDESCREIRSVSHNMMPNALLKNSLSTAVRDFIDKLDKKALNVHIYTEGLDERLDSNMESVLYRVIQECVNNVIKHAEANTLDISITRDETEISVTIEDNGKGFDVQKKSESGGIGLKNIRSRIEYLKGTVDFDSKPGKGTLVAVHVPLP